MNPFDAFAAPINRRENLKRGLAVALSWTTGGLSACGGGGAQSDAPSSSPAPAPAPAAPLPAPIGPAGSGLVTGYDPTDPDVLVAATLTQPLAATQAASPVGDKGRAQVKIGGTPRFDAVAGLTVGANGYLRFVDIAGASRLSTDGWQLYFEIDRHTLALLPAMSPGSSGLPIADTQYVAHLSSGENFDSSHADSFTISTDKLPIYAAGSGSGVGTNGIAYNDAVLPSSATHVAVVLWGLGDQTNILIDGVAPTPMTSPASLDIANVLEFSGASAARVRHLMLVARPPRFVVHPLLKSMAVLGDSYAQFDSDYLHSGTYSASAYLQTLAQVAKAGRSLQWSGDGTHQTFPGNHLLGFATASAPLNLHEAANTSTDNLWDKKQQILDAHAPDILLMQSGANDVSLDGSLPDLDRWQAWVLEWARWALGEGGYAPSSIRKFGFCTTPWSPAVGPGFGAARLARFTAMQQAAFAALKQFAQLYPGRANDVMVIDQFAAFGGAATPAARFSDAASSDAGEHPSVAGNIVKGQTWGAAVVRFLQQ